MKSPKVLFIKGSVAKHNILGKKGEKAAIDLLMDRGYRILAKNWRFMRAEIDIIAKTDKTLVIIEVKTRSSESFGQPSDFVDWKKRQLLIDAATEYAINHSHDGEIRFDIIGVLVRPEGGFRIRHIEDAFYPDIQI
ncbi:MAG: YraN family protein [Saprospiraceae bacterium]|nr:YraN family protein [Saprospiraceae bacterium]